MAKAKNILKILNNNGNKQPNIGARADTQTHPFLASIREKDYAPLNGYDLWGHIQGSLEEVEKIEVAVELLEIMLAVPDKAQSPEKIKELLQEKHSYFDLVEFPDDREIYRVGLTDRARGKNLLENLDKEYIDQLLNVKSANEIKNILAEKLKRHGISLDIEKMNEVLDPETRRAIRIEFDGMVRFPDKDLMTKDYWSMVQDKHTNPAKYQDFTAPDYNLSGTFWDKISPLPSIKMQEEDVKKALIHNKISQDMLAKMNIYDFEDMFLRYSQDIGRSGIASAKICEGSRAYTIKEFIKNHEKEFIGELQRLGTDSKEIERAVKIMGEDGRIPSIKIGEEWCLTATVHHNISIYDAGQLKDPYYVNNPENHIIMFEIKDAKDLNKNKRRAEKPIEKLLRDNSVKLEGEIDLKQITIEKNAKKEFIRTIARDNADAIMSSMENIGIDKNIIKHTIEQMSRDGKIPPIPIEGGFMGVSLRKTKSDIKLEFGIMEIDNKYADIHQAIMHGLSIRPISMPEGFEENTNSISAELRPKDKSEFSPHYSDEKDAFHIDDKNTENTRRQIMRIRGDVLKNVQDNGKKIIKRVVCYVGDLTRPIFSNHADMDSAKNRYKNIKRINSAPAIRTINYGGISK